MPGMEFGDFDALPDPLMTDRFGILIEPTASPNINAVLALRCTQIAVPEEMFDVMTVAIQGMEFNFRGRRTFDRQIGASFIETVDGALLKGMRTWMQQIAGSESQNGLYKKGYSTLGTLEVYDQGGLVALEYNVRNTWPSGLPQVTLEGAQAQPYTQNVNFTYDKFLMTGIDEL